MDERKVLWRISAILFVLAFCWGIAFVASGFLLGYMVLTAVCLIGSFMSFAISFAA